MPIASRTPESPPRIAARPAFGDPAFHGLPGVLLHPGGPWTLPEGQGTAEENLACAARLLVLLIDRPARRPARWSGAAFAAAVELVRSHLRPIGTAASLAASFEREAFHGPLVAGSHLPFMAHPAGVAYSVRWLELYEGRTVPEWVAWIAGR
jgi:hypothetical protein